jgi:predicted DNA binding protein
VRDRMAGATIEELAADFGIHRTTVMAHLKRRSPSS